MNTNTARHLVAAWLLAAAVPAPLGVQGDVAAQTQRAPARRPATPAATAMRSEPAMMNCPTVLGTGVTTKQVYCDVPIAADYAGGVIITLPPHTGPVTLTFDLHNRHTYSEEMVKANRAFSRYTAGIGIMAMDNTLLARAVVQNEFRTAADLVDRISGGGGPGGLKAVAPTGKESIKIEIPAEEQSLSLLGERLSVVRLDGVDNFTFSASGRPIAVVSNVMVHYRPAPAARQPARRR